MAIGAGEREEEACEEGEKEGMDRLAWQVARGMSEGSLGARCV